MHLCVFNETINSGENNYVMKCDDFLTKLENIRQALCATAAPADHSRMH